MPFVALLTKELRSRLRRERTIWIIIAYILLMSLLGWIVLGRYTGYSTYGSNNFSNAGINFYTLLSMIQLFLILFATPAFTSTAVNGEKERQTFDLLLCSQLSSFSLVAGKLIAGLVNALLLVIAAIPLFSLVFLFGGISPEQVLIALLIYLVTALMSGTFGVLCSTLFKRPTTSTVVTYLAGALWLVMPAVISYLWVITTNQSPSSSQVLLLFAWHPVMAMISSYSTGNSFFVFSAGGLKIAQWTVYALICLVAAALFFSVSMWAAKPNPSVRLRAHLRARRKKSDLRNKATATA